MKVLDWTRVEDVEFDGIDTSDAMDFSNAYISSAAILDGDKWRDATDRELDLINSDSGEVYERLLKILF